MAEDVLTVVLPEVRELLREHYGLVGALHPLASELSTVAQLTCGTGAGGSADRDGGADVAADAPATGAGAADAAATDASAADAPATGPSQQDGGAGAAATATVMRAEDAAAEFVVKLTRYTPEALAVARWRAEAMRRLNNAGIPVGALRPARDGEAVTVVSTSGGDAMMQVSDWLYGDALDAITPSLAALRDIGATAARISRALADFPGPPAAVAHPWELAQTLPVLDATAPAITDPQLAALVAAARERFAQRVAPVLPELPWQVVHHDLHDSNMLMAGERVSGVLDFGDMVWGPRIAELAIAAVYASRRSPDPLSAFLAVLEGAGSGLTRAEAEVVADAGIARLAVNAAVWASRMHTDRAEYARSRSATTHAALAALLAEDASTIRAAARARLGW